jgi:Pam16
MASRIIAQLLVMGGTQVARAVVTAYQQALVNSAARGGAAAGGAAAGAAATRAGVMRAEEAAEVLGVRRNAGLKDITTKYEQLFTANDPAVGGSQYLQAKIHNAKVTLEREAIARGEIPPPPPPPPRQSQTSENASTVPPESS